MPEAETKTRRKSLKRMDQNDEARTRRERDRAERVTRKSRHVGLSRAVMHDTMPLRNWKLTQKNRVTSPGY